MRRKGFVSPLIIVLVIALLTGATMLLLLKSKTSKINSKLGGNVNTQSTESLGQPTSSPSTKPLSDLGYSENSEAKGWKLYKNNKYNFSFLYPDNWIFDVKDSTGGAHPFLDIHLSNSKSTDNLITQCTPSYSGMEIQVSHWRSSEQTFDEFVKNNTSPEGKGLNPGGQLEQLTVNGKTTYKVERSGWDTACTGPGYFIDQNVNTYTYIFTGHGSTANFGIAEKIVNSIKYN